MVIFYYLKYNTLFIYTYDISVVFFLVCLFFKLESLAITAKSAFPPKNYLVFHRRKPFEIATMRVNNDRIFMLNCSFNLILMGKINSKSKFSVCIQQGCSEHEFKLNRCLSEAESLDRIRF